MRATRTVAVVCAAVSVLLAWPAAAAPAGTVYDDALASGWTDWSWSSTRDFAVTSPVSSGARALAVTLQAYGGLSLHDGAGSISGMDTLALSIDGGTAGGDFQVFVTRAGQALTAVSLAQYCTGKTVPKNAWTRCTVPFSALGAAGAAVDGVGLRDVTGAARATIYLDDVGFLPRAPAAPTGLTATASAGRIDLTWSAAAGATGYQVQRATSSAGTFAPLTSAPQAGTTYSDAAVTAGATYWYRVTATNAGGTSAASATVSATVPAATATAYVLYGDALPSGWVDWSWSATRDFAAAAPVAEGTRSLAVTLQANGGLSLHDGAGSVSGMDTLSLSIDGGAAAGGDYQAFLTSNGQVLNLVMLAQYCAGGVIPANAWTRCTVPFSALGATGLAVDGLGLRDVSGAARATFYLDDVRFTQGGAAPSLPAAPTGLAATAGAGKVSLAWSAVAGASGYDVYRATASAGPFTRLIASQAATSYADTAVTAGVAYWYQVRAVNAAGAGPASATVTATPSASAQTVVVTVTPATATVDACTAVKLAAAVTGTSDGSVTWSVQEGASAGTVDAAGNFTAADYVGTVHVVATSKASPSASATATLAVQEHVLSLAINPGTAKLSAGGQVQFTATVTTTCKTFTAQ